MTVKQILIWLLVIGYSLMPLLITANPYPPGYDPVVIERIAKSSWFGGTYKGWLPAKFIGVTLYYYLTPTLMFIGLRILLGNIHKALLAWVFLLLLTPAIWYNMIGGTWISQVNMYLVGLVAVKGLAEYYKTKNVRWLLIGLIFSFITPIWHTETGTYIGIAIGSYLLFSRNWKLWPTAVPILVGIVISLVVLNPGKAQDIKTSLIDRENMPGVFFVEYEGNKTSQVHASGNTATYLRQGSSATVTLSNGSHVTAEPIFEKDLGFDYWLREMTGGRDTVYLLLVLTGIILVRTPKFRFDTSILILLSALPILMFFAWSPWSINGHRTGVHITGILAVFLSTVFWSLWQENNKTNQMIMFLVLATAVISNSNYWYNFWSTSWH